MNPAASAAHRLIVGLAISNIGTWSQRISLDLLILKAVGLRGLALSIVLQQMPAALLVQPTGWLSDRLNRRRLLVVLDLTLAAISVIPAILVATGSATGASLLGYALASGILLAFEATTRHTLLAQLAMEASSLRLLGLASVIPNLGRMVGPVVGASLITLFGHPAAHLANAVSFLLAGLLITIIPSAVVVSPPPSSGEGLLAPLRRVGAFPDLVILGWALMMTQATRVYLPYLANNDASTYGRLLALVGAGGLAAAVLTWRCESIILSVRVGVQSAAVLPIFALCLVLPNPVIVAVASIALGFFSSLLIVWTRIAVNLRIDEGARGRASAAIVAVVQGSIPLSSLIAAGVIGVVGFGTGMVGLEVLAFVGLTGLFRWRNRTVRG